MLNFKSLMLYNIRSRKELQYFVAFRQQFSSVRSAPQSVCHEEEKAEINQYATVLSRSTQQQHQQQEQQGGAGYSEQSTHGYNALVKHY